MIANVNMSVYLKFGENWTTNMGDIISPILLVIIVPVESQYPKNRERYRSEILHTSRVQLPDVH